MPTYAYRCSACGNAFDIQQSFTEDSLTVCDVCGGELRKVFGAVGVAFKGSGFYRNDSAAGSKPSGGAASPAPTPATSGSPAPAAAPAAAASAS